MKTKLLTQTSHKDNRTNHALRERKFPSKLFYSRCLYTTSMCGIFDILEKKHKRLKNKMLQQHLILKRE